MNDQVHQLGCPWEVQKRTQRYHLKLANSLLCRNCACPSHPCSSRNAEILDPVVRT